MAIGDVIRKYRKNLGLTQTEMAARLGVTTPAVNKWENNNSQPDITLLAPIARLLHITTDTLLSFTEDLTEEEISHFVEELNEKLINESYADAFACARENAEKYPNCEKLIWSLAVVLDAGMPRRDISDETAYDDQILRWYLRSLESKDYTIKKAAANSLWSFYIRKKQYEKAEEYLNFLPKDDPGRERQQAYLYSQTGKKQEAFKAYERLLLSGYNNLSMLLNDLQILYIREEDFRMARKLVYLRSALARLFEMGRYQEAAAGLDLAVSTKDVAKTERIMRSLLDHLDTLTDVARSDLYRHLYDSPEKTKPAISGHFREKFQKELAEGFLDEEVFGYMRGNAYWEKWKKTGEKTDRTAPFCVIHIKR